MHNGSLSTLADVVAGYNQGSPAVESIDTDIRPLELTAKEMDDLV
jgi:cytochrome c peroxidase